MNILHVRYAVEVDKTRSISKAAENLHIGQPNLSRAIKDLEESLGIVIFKRTSKGILPTAAGETFIAHARRIVAQIDEVEALYRREEARAHFSISAPRADYLARAFAAFVARMDKDACPQLRYRETDAAGALENVLQDEDHMGILRYAQDQASQVEALLKEKGLKSQTLGTFLPQLLFAPAHPLAQKQRVFLADLAPFIEVVYAEASPFSRARHARQGLGSTRGVCVYDRATRLALLKQLPGAYTWDAPMCAEALTEQGIVSRPLAEDALQYRDVLIYKKGYRMRALDKAFLALVEEHRP
nr:LysR family transcriptional regulator [Maliibacterium massiliense]